MSARSFAGGFLVGVITPALIVLVIILVRSPGLSAPAPTTTPSPTHTALPTRTPTSTPSPTALPTKTPLPTATPVPTALRVRPTIVVLGSLLL